MWNLSSRTRDWTCVPCIGRQILNHYDHFFTSQFTLEITLKPVHRDCPHFFFSPFQLRSTLLCGFIQPSCGYQLLSCIWAFELLPIFCKWFVRVKDLVHFPVVRGIASILGSWESVCLLTNRPQAAPSLPCHGLWLFRGSGVINNRDNGKSSVSTHEVTLRMDAACQIPSPQLLLWAACLCLINF